jgi:predicted aspartyl protease
MEVKTEQAIANVEIRHGEKTLELKCLVDTGASKSVISKRLAEKMAAFIPFKKPEEPYEIKTADREGKLRLIGYCRLGVKFQGVEVPGGAVFEVAENLREDLDLVIGRPEIDAWDIIFTSEGPRPKKVPIEFEII